MDDYGLDWSEDNLSKDIEIVMRYVKWCSKETAFFALKQCHGDIVNAIIALEDLEQKLSTED